MNDPPRMADPRLWKLLGGEELASLRKRLRRRFERAAEDKAASRLHLASLTGPEYEALAQLTGQPPKAARSIRIDLASLDARLRAAGVAGSLREALERLDGPIIHGSLRTAEQLRWSALAQECRDVRLATYQLSPDGLGMLKRLARQSIDRAALLLARAQAVLERLPAPGLARAQLAADALGDAHALDDGQPAATLVLAVWRQSRDEPAPPEPALDGDAAEEGGEVRRERSRETWARAGVLVNELARPALVLNLPTMAPDDAYRRGEPVYLSLRRLVRAPPRWDLDGRTVFVCENPNLVAIAADGLGERCAPLVCTEGMPAAAQRALLSQLSDAGCRLRYHGDFDWPGLRIAGYVMRTWIGEPWRFAAADYEAAARNAAQQRTGLAGPAVEAAWDAELSEAMRRHGLAIPEEAVAGTLLEDLGAADL